MYKIEYPPVQSGVTIGRHGLIDYRYAKLAEQMFARERTYAWSFSLYPDPEQEDMTCTALTKIALGIFEGMKPPLHNRGRQPQWRGSPGQLRGAQRCLRDNNRKGTR